MAAKAIDLGKIVNFTNTVLHCNSSIYCLLIIIFIAFQNKTHAYQQAVDKEILKSRRFHTLDSLRGEKHLKKPDGNRCDIDIYNAEYPCGNFTRAVKFKTCLKDPTDVQALSWEKARAECDKMHSQIVTVTDQSFAEYLTATYPHTFWINGIRTEAGGDFRTSSGENLAFTNWKHKNLRSQGRRDNCISMDSTDGGKWDMLDCTKTLKFICQKTDLTFPSAPVLRINTTPTSHSYVLYGGDIFTATCSAYDLQLPNSSSLTFEFNSYLVDQKTAIPTKEEFLRNKLQRCMKRVNLTLSLTVDSDLDRETLRCCVEGNGGGKLCSRNVTLAVTYKRRQPELKVNKYQGPGNLVYVGEGIYINCRAYVGTQGRLLVIVAEKESAPQTLADFHLNTSNSVEFKNGTEIKYKFRHSSEQDDKKLGPLISSRLNLNYIDVSYDDMTVSCAAVDKNFNASNLSSIEPSFVASTTMRVRYRERKPELDVKYHGQPYIIHYGQTLTAVCTTSTSSKHISWLLDAQKNSDDTVWHVEVSSGKADNQKSHARFTTQKEFIDEHHGYKVISTIELKIEPYMGEAILYCDSRYINTTTDYAVSRSTTGTASKTFKLIYLPEKPKLTTRYTRPKYFGRHPPMLHANCTARVGNSGVLTWAIFTPETVRLWWVHPGGNVDVPFSSGMDRHAPDVTLTRIIGKRKNKSFIRGEKDLFIGSRISVVVNASQIRNKLACFSRNFSAARGPTDIGNFSDIKKQEEDFMAYTTITDEGKPESLMEALKTDSSLRFLLFGAIVAFSIINLGIYFVVRGFKNKDEEEEYEGYDYNEEYNEEYDEEKDGAGFENYETTDWNEFNYEEDEEESVTTINSTRASSAVTSRNVSLTSATSTSSTSR